MRACVCVGGEGAQGVLLVCKLEKLCLFQNEILNGVFFSTKMTHETPGATQYQEGYQTCQKMHIKR